MTQNWKLAYISSITDDSDVAFENILRTSRTNNLRSGLSGLIMRDRSSYFQYLEGPHDALGQCMLRIAGDARHSQVTLLLSVPTDILLFDSWTLAEAALPKRKRSLSAFARMLLDAKLLDRLTLIEQTCMDATSK